MNHNSISVFVSHVKWDSDFFLSLPRQFKTNQRI